MNRVMCGCFVPRNVSPAEVPGATATGVLHIYPNPAADALTVDNPADIAADRYSIKDVLGQTVKDGSLVTGTQELSLLRMVPGNYIISMYKAGVPVGNKMFVKE